MDPVRTNEHRGPAFRGTWRPQGRWRAAAFQKLPDWGYGPSRRMYSLDMRHMFSTTVAPGFTLPGVTVFPAVNRAIEGPVATRLLLAKERSYFAVRSAVFSPG
jgi:hypothetical protein